jgi:hypothetical protein
MLVKNFILPIFIYCFFALPGNVFAQVCSGSFGDPVVNIDFGRGTNFYGSPLGQNTNYQFIQSTGLHDGFYTIVKSMGGGAWHQVSNHTPNDPDGYMLMVNASNEPGVFYETVVATDLCPNTTYEFAAWVMNLMMPLSNRPNLTFAVLTLDDQVLSTYNSGDIIETQVPTWKQYGFLFTTSGVSRVKIRIINNGPGGYGNDLSLDDITFRACGPKITAGIDNSAVSERTICENENVPFVLSAKVEGSATLQYLWQKNIGNGWTDLNAGTSTELRVNPQSLSVGDHQYRLMTAEATNFNSPACRTASSVITIHVKHAPQPVVVSSQIVCLGNSILLGVTGIETDMTYVWTGPNSYSSTEKSPVLSNADLGMSGAYKVTVSSGGCSASATVNVSVVPPPVAAVSATDIFICEGASITLQASGGSTYKWAPATGLSATDISDPVASPVISTLYTITVSNGGCTDTAHVIVNVFRKTGANAGSNQAIIEGQSITLDGRVSGNSIRYFWTPSDYLDNPAKLNPVASPPHDMTYVLNVWSEENCPGSTSSVSIRV